MATSNHKMSNTSDEVNRHLLKIFGKLFDREIIESVALNCNYNVEDASDILLEMSSNITTTLKHPTERRKKVIPQAATIKNSPNNNTLAKNKSFHKTHVPNPAALKKTKKDLEIERVIQRAKQGERLLILMRGVPGSGKSFLSRSIINHALNRTDYKAFILSADDYFIKRNGLYVYDVTKLTDAHMHTQRKANLSMQDGISPIIIDNTNVQMWEMKPYASMATSFAYAIEILEPNTHWAFNDKELARRCTHGVPRQKIKEMLERYEKNITPAKLMGMYNLSYRMKLPVPRNYPPISYDNHNHIVDVSKNTRGSRPIPERIPASAPLLNSPKSNTTGPFMVATGDLMDFENEVPFSSSNLSSAICISDDEDEVVIHQASSFDNILMLERDSKMNILAPKICKTDAAAGHKTGIAQNTNTSLQGDSQGDNNSTPSRSLFMNTKCNNIYPNLNLSSWGLAENAISSWESWNIVSPLKESGQNSIGPQSTTSTSDTISIQPSVDALTNTCSADFQLLASGQPGSKSVKIMIGQNRDITAGMSVTPPLTPPQKTTFDKSSMTNDDVLNAVLARERSANDAKYFEELTVLFPNISNVYLRDVYEKCKGDVNWVVDLLLDDNTEGLTSLTLQHDTDAPEVVAEQVDGGETEYNRPESPVDEIVDNVDYLKKMKEREEEESRIELKKIIEQNVVINRNCYSERVLKIKNMRHGSHCRSGCVEQNSPTNVAVSAPAYVQQNTQPTTSKINKFEACPTESGEVIVIESDVDLDDFEPDLDLSQIEDDMMELNLGEYFVSQLEQKFGHNDLYPQGFLPIVQIPISLARQLHAFYLESVFQQMENQNQILEMMVKEDEEFAKRLQAQEQHEHRLELVPPTPNLQDIMDEQAASNLYQQEIEQWKKLTPDDLASRLTRQKLFSSFPTVNQSLLVEILHAYNNNYQQTVDVLLSSTDSADVHDPDGNVMVPPITESLVEEMKVAESDTNEVSIHNEGMSANDYRIEARKFLNKREQLFERAQQAYQTRQYEVALFYSELAKKQTQLYDRANGLAATAFLQENSQKLHDFDTLDLHYLYVKEAIAALDIFVDNNIMLLKGSQKQHQKLFVITGRGKNSDNGRSRLKPAVKRRLQTRNVGFWEMNPGLLKIKIFQNSSMTSDIP